MLLIFFQCKCTVWQIILSDAYFHLAEMGQLRNIAARLNWWNARMAELVDASDSKSDFRKGVQVRFLFRAPWFKAEV